MIFREATISDIQQIQIVRHSVKENVLSNPSMVTDKDCEDYLTLRGKGWVCELNGTVVGFSIADMEENNIWALFVHPDHEAMGIGKRLHKEMLDWYFNQTKETVWLGTAPKTKAERFYRKNGWKEVGVHGKGEIKFEMSFEDWKSKKITAENVRSRVNAEPLRKLI
ncbi:MAG TPA: GNAT family N-acetyltransferase [Chitinophagaceae bacterium]|nr:GNAT family N-acetyltransferase [Chitinophagaceae bacterium]